MMGINFPRVLAKFHEAEQASQMLLAQQEYQTINRAIERRQESLANLSHVPGIVDVSSGRKSALPREILYDRVTKLVSRQYQNEKDIVLFHIVNFDGQEKIRIERQPDGTFQQKPTSQKDFRQVAHWQKMFSHNIESLSEKQRILLEKSPTTEEDLFVLSVTIPEPTGAAGVACLKFSLHDLLEPYKDHVIFDGNGMILNSSKDEISHKGWVQEITRKASHIIRSSQSPSLLSLHNDSTIALIPIYIGQRPTESIWMGYVPATGDTMTWVHAWRVQVLVLLSIMLCAILLLAILLANWSKRFRVMIESGV